MTALESFMKGLEFVVYGVFGDTLEFDNERGERQRMVRFISAGKTYNFAVGTDEELAKYKLLKGSLARATGVILRSKNSTSVKPQIASYVLQGQAGWKDPMESDIFSGCVVTGCVRVVKKRTGVYNGNPYWTVVVMSFGDVFEIAHVDPEKYDGIPPTGLMMIRCFTEPRFSRNDNGKYAEMDLVLDMFKAADAEPSGSAAPRPSRESKSA